MLRPIHPALWLAACALAPAALQDETAPALDPQVRACERLLALAEDNARLELGRGEHAGSDTHFVQGWFTVPENRDTGEGRELRLGLVVLPARAEEPAPDPVFLLHGGPGAPATAFFRAQLRGWLRERRDVVLVDQRGSGSSNALRVRLSGSDDDLQGYFASYFEPEAYRAALPELQERADLSQYTTPHAVDDFDELRAALGYEQVNLRGGSYGTRSALVWMRRHPSSIRTATLQGVQPIAYLNPLPHARGAQESLDLIFAEVRADERASAAFPELEAKFAATLERLEREPAQVRVRHPRTGAPTPIELTRNAFAEAVRLQLYTLQRNRRLPALLERAHAGDYRELAEAFLAQSRAVRSTIAWGLLIAVTESEDLARLDRSLIAEACANTFLGTTRIDEQLAVADFWPSGRVHADFGEPVRAEVPTLLWSGTHDPSTTPAWGAEAARHLPRSLHVVIPSGHGVFGPEVEAVDRAFLEAGSVDGLDLEPLSALELPPFWIPED